MLCVWCYVDVLWSAGWTFCDLRLLELPLSAATLNHRIACLHTSCSVEAQAVALFLTESGLTQADFHSGVHHPPSQPHFSAHRWHLCKPLLRLHENFKTFITDTHSEARSSMPSVWNSSFHWHLSNWSASQCHYGTCEPGCSMLHILCHGPQLLPGRNSKTKRRKKKVKTSSQIYTYILTL